MKKRSFLNFIYISFCFIYTKIFFKNIRLFRLPIDIRNKSKIDFGLNLTTGKNCRIEAYGDPEKVNLFFGSNVELNDSVHITASNHVSIGNNVLMASKIYISDTSHGSYAGNENDSHPDTPPGSRPLYNNKVLIEDNVWLGEFVSVLPGVVIGQGTIVGANSVVSKSLPSYVIAVGSPAKPIKKYNFKSQRWERIV